MELLEKSDAEFEVYDYMKKPLTSKKLRAIINKLKIKPEELVRKKESLFKSEFKGKILNSDEWIQIMIDHPKLMERPILVKGRKAVIGRPPESILSIL